MKLWSRFENENKKIEKKSFFPLQIYFSIFSGCFFFNSSLGPSPIREIEFQYIIWIWNFISLQTENWENSMSPPYLPCKFVSVPFEWLLLIKFYILMHTLQFTIFFGSRFHFGFLWLWLWLCRRECFHAKTLLWIHYKLPWWTESICCLCRCVVTVHISTMYDLMLDAMFCVMEFLVVCSL